MVENVVKKAFGLVLIVTGHMAFSDPGYANNMGIVGQNITFHFKFNTTIKNDTRISIYKSERQEKKISQYSRIKSDIQVHSETSSVFYHMAHLTLNDTEVYWATLFVDNGPPILSNKVQLIVREDYRSTTVPPLSTNLLKPVSGGSSSSSSSHVVTVLVVLPVMLLVALLPFLICCLEKTKERQEKEEQQRGSIPTVQETIEESSLVYSVLDFPKRPPAAVEFQTSGTEYATICYLTEKRPRAHTDKWKLDDRSVVQKNV